MRFVWLVLKKDLLMERRSLDVVTSTAMFSVLVLLIASLSFYIDVARAKWVAPGVLWVATAFGCVVALSRTWAREDEYGVFYAVWTSPVPRLAIFLGKSLSTWLLLVVVELVVVPLWWVFFHMQDGTLLGPLCLALGLGTLGFVSVGTVFGALTLRSLRRDLILSTVVFPLVTPSLMAGTAFTRELFLGVGDGSYGWLRLLLAFDLIGFAVGAFVFQYAVED